MNKIISYKEFLNESKTAIVTEANQEEQIKKECISKLSDFFRVSPNALSHFKFDGKDPIKELTKALNATSYEGAEQYYRVAIIMAKRDLGIHESVESEEVNEKAMDTKYWIGYNDAQGPKWQSEKSTNFEDTFNTAIDGWNDEAEGPENQIKGSQIKNIKKLAEEFFKKEKFITFNIIQAMIMQES